MTFLEMCQKVAEESGTVATLPNPATVTGQTGRLGRIVGWVNSAYGLIQSLHPDWLWMRGTFEGSLLTGVREYDGAAVGVTSFARFARMGRGTSVASVYDPAIGRSDEGVLLFRPYDEFYETFLIGERATLSEKPSHITRTPEGKFSVWPLPDKTYTVRGMYHKGRQVLTVDADVPDLPDEYHMAIVYRALVLLATFDEGAPQLPIWNGEFTALMAGLSAHYLPQLEVGGPLA